MTEFIPFSIRLGLKPKNIVLSPQKKLFYAKLGYLKNIFKYFQENYLNEKVNIKFNNYSTISDTLNRIDISIITAYDFNSISLNSEYMEFFNSFKSIFTLDHVYSNLTTMEWTNCDRATHIKTFYIVAYIDCTIEIDPKTLAILQLFQLT